ncbi:unnamed protein product [Cyprideis torosa]|uniref:Uncharacterized protein n=1 Tax=Cyprideis torosa TaxID=163714 RepID=A0A7R8ZJY3_9CRUS|nr:unnamed protein product [Cyprideis torosa]CAG0883297.1 unnamed protein product [Cyprideis torosa]
MRRVIVFLRVPIEGKPYQVKLRRRDAVSVLKEDFPRILEQFFEWISSVQTQVLLSSPQEVLFSMIFTTLSLFPVALALSSAFPAEQERKPIKRSSGTPVYIPRSQQQQQYHQPPPQALQPQLQGAGTEDFPSTYGANAALEHADGGGFQPIHAPSLSGIAPSVSGASGGQLSLPASSEGFSGGFQQQEHIPHIEHSSPHIQHIEHSAPHHSGAHVEVPQHGSAGGNFQGFKDYAPAHGDEVAYGAETGERGAFSWYVDIPVGKESYH